MEAMELNKLHRLFVVGGGRAWKRAEKFEDLSPVVQIAAGQLPEDMRVGDNLALLKEFDEPCVAPAKVIHPD